MEIEYDPAKRAATLVNRGLDFADAGEVFAGLVVERDDDRFDYGEVRTITVGLLRGVVVVVIWTDRGDKRRIISMRRAEKGEQHDYYRRLG